jgi:uncharacterized protein (TIGR02145 family)
MTRGKFTLFTAICVATAFTFFACEEKKKAEAEPTVAEAPPTEKAEATPTEGAEQAVAEEASEPEETPHEIQYGSPLTYEGQTYKTVTIGEQTWMAENLNYKTGKSECYENDEANCKKYGRLYDWATAMKACPNGWHLPSKEEWESLDFGDSKTAGKKLKAASGWEDYREQNGNGEDKYGFAALPGGYFSADGFFNEIGFFGIWYSASEEDSNNAYFRNMNNEEESAYWGSYGGKSGLFSVRCVKD